MNTKLVHLNGGKVGTIRSSREIVLVEGMVELTAEEAAAYEASQREVQDG